MIDALRGRFGVEPICRALELPTSTYYAHTQRHLAPSPRRQRDGQLMAEIQRVWKANYQVYGARKVWRQLRREGTCVARCTVEQQRLAELEREVRELRRANDILKAASAFFARELDPRLPRS